MDKFFFKKISSKFFVGFLLITLVGSPLSVLANNSNDENSSSTSIEICDAKSTEIVVPGIDEDGVIYNNDQGDGLFRIEMTSPVGLSDADYANYSWGNWHTDDRARHHGSSLFIIKNAAPIFGPDTDPVTKDSHPDGKRVVNWTAKIDSLLLDPTYDESRSKVANAGRGVGVNMELNNGDSLNFIVNAIKDIGDDQGSYTQNVGKVHIHICKINIPQVITHSCMLPNSLGDSTVEPIVHGLDTYSLQDIFNQLSINKNVISDQKQYQEWNVGQATTSVTVEFLSKNAGLNSTFGYYLNTDKTSFSPKLSTVGQTATFDLSPGSKIGFGIDISNGTFYATHNSINENSNDHSVVYELANNVYIIAFEDLALASSDTDYNDIIVKITVNNCIPVVSPTNTPPIITLIGANPLNITVGNVFTDPGVTATDTEDGDLTSAIVRTGSVNASTTGTYTLTYVVKDSGNLYATTTRTVIVNPVSTTTPPVEPPANPPTNTGGGGGGGNLGGHRHDISTISSGGEILGATSCAYLRDYLKIDWQNDPIEVLKLQSFLNVFEGEALSLTGVFNQGTHDAVERFQIKYNEDILIPWGDKVTTGFVYILTKKKVNEIYCNTIYPLNTADQNEINAFRNSKNNNSNGQNGDTNDHVGFIQGSNVGSSALGSIAIDGSPIVKLKNDSPANKSVIKNLAVSLFALPQKILSEGKYIAIFLIILLIIIAVIKYLFGPKEKGGSDFDSTPSSQDVVVEDGDPVIDLPPRENFSENLNQNSTASLPPDEIIIDSEENLDEIEE